MAVDYWLEWECHPRRWAQGSLGLLEHRRHQALADQAIVRLGDARQPFEITVSRDGRPVRQTVTAQGLHDQATIPQDVAAACRPCTANLAGQTLGCFGTVTWPISDEAEQWLMTLPSNPASTLTGHLLSEMIYGEEFTGAPLAALRERLGAFSRDRSVEVTYGTGAGAHSLDSDHVLHALWGVESRTPREALMLAVMLNVVVLDGRRIAEADDMRLACRLIADEEDRPELPQRLVFDLPLSAGRPPATAQGLVEYLTALLAAALLGCPLGVKVSPPVEIAV